jgi:hypothetical protein
MRDMARQVPTQAVGYPVVRPEHTWPVQVWIVGGRGRDVQVELPQVQWRLGSLVSAVAMAEF